MPRPDRHLLIHGDGRDVGGDTRAEGANRVSLAGQAGGGS